MRICVDLWRNAIRRQIRAISSASTRTGKGRNLAWKHHDVESLSVQVRAPGARPRMHVFPQDRVIAA